MMCIFMLTSPHLAIFPRAASISQPPGAQQPDEWNDWDLAQLGEEACARTERATLWTPRISAPPPATRPQRRPSPQIPWTRGIVALKEAMLTLCLPHMTLWLMVRDTPALSPLSSDHTAILCTYGGTTRGHMGQMKG